MNTIKKAYQTILCTLGEDPTRQGLLKTPERAAQAIVDLTAGYTQNLDGIINGAIYESDNDEMVILKDIEFYSLCEHHLLPFVGKCHIGYLPNKKVIGISKIARIVDHFSKRLQIQENLTKQIADCLLDKIDAKGVGVIIEAQHFCMMMRGVQKQNSTMSTSMMLGLFRSDDKTRAEFLSLIKG
jgi:GTP cyclohydrolase I